MTTERNNGREAFDPLAKTREIIDLVLDLDYDKHDLPRVVEAVGQVRADLHVLDRYHRRAGQLANGVTTEDVDNAARHMREAAALRPLDDQATENRILVLAGLQFIRQYTKYNERVANRPDNGIDGITIFQVGITPEFVEQAIEHVNQVKQLVEAAPRIIKEVDPEPKVETSSPIGIPNQIEGESEADNVPTEVIETPIFLPPDNFISMQAGVNEKPEEPKPQSIKRRSRGLTRRGLLKWGVSTLVTAATVGQITKMAPILDWVSDALDWHPNTSEQSEDIMRKYSLTEKPVRLGDWYAMYPILEKDEGFVDIFNNFKQINTNKLLSTPIYAPVGENNPFPLLVTDASVRFEVYESKFTPPMVVVKYGDSGRNWYIVSGRKAPEDPEQRPYANIIQITNAVTKSNFYLEVKPVRIQDNDKIEIRYMKRVKTPLSQPQVFDPQPQI